MRIYILIVFLLSVLQTFGQNLDPESLNSGGAKAETQNNEYIINYTVGQPFISNVSTDFTGNYQVTHGFQQFITNPEKFIIGSIPNQNIGQGNAVEFFIGTDIGAGAILSMTVNEPPYGEIYFSNSTGYFKYQADTLDHQPFTVTFNASLNGSDVSQTITLTPEVIINPVQGDFFGYSAGNFGVSENGASTYTIPITVLPGTAGMQPELAFSYTSQNSNGIMGPGWVLGGLSTISRSPATYAQDNYIDGVDFDERDRFNLDGERLIVVNGGVYGENGTEYYTEQNSFSKITSFAEAGITTKFVVQTKSGLIKEYGATPDSRIEAQGRNAVMYWALNKISDTKGNYINISYGENYATGEFYPEEISYTGNTEANIAPYNKVVFEYENRHDPTENYVYGSKVSKSKRLLAVKIKHQSTTVREYRLRYTNSIYSKLISIQEFGRGGLQAGEKFEPTKFVWQANTLFNLAQSSDNISISEFNDNVQMIPGDWNKDGISDVLLFNKTTGENNWFINDGNLGFTKYTEKILPAEIAGGTGLYFGDFNGDGYRDIVWWDKATGNNKWFLAQITQDGQFSFIKNTFSVTTTEIDNGEQLSFGDYNGDGLTDFFWYDKATGNNSWYLNQTYITGNLAFRDRANNLVNWEKIKDATAVYTADWNADGLADVMAWHKTSGNNYWFLNVGLVDNELNFYHEETPIITTEIQGGSNLYFGDWNADGVTDLMWFNDATGDNHWFVNKGDYTFESTVNNPIAPNILKNTMSVLYFNDWNADGYTDLIWSNYQTGASKHFINKGNFLFARNDNIIKTDKIKEGSGFLFGDWKGTGHAGMVWYDKSSGKNNWFVNEVTNTNLIQKIIKGSGAEINIDYKSLIDNSVYQKYHAPSYPEADFISPLQVVSSYNTSNGKGGRNTFNYFYEGGKTDMQGRGFRGFKKTIITDEQTGLQNISLYERDFKFVGNKLKKTFQLQSSGDTVSVSEYVNDYNEHMSSYFSYYPTEITRKFETDGSLISQTVTSKEYDDYGNPTEIVIDYGEGFVDTVTNTYVNDIDKWYLGRLTQTVVSKTIPGQETSRRTSEFTYDMEGTNASGMLVSETVEPDNETLSITKTYTHDAFGNILTSTISGHNGTEVESRTTTTTYGDNGRFVLTHSNALGHTQTKTYDPLLGNVISVTDPNNLTVEYQFDNFGRNVREIRPDGTETVISHLWSKDINDQNPPANAMYATHIQNTGKPLQIVWYDTLGREIRKEIEGFDGTRIYTDTEYDNTGNVLRKSDPYFRDATRYWTSIQYDAFDRAVQQTAPGNRITNISYQGLETVYTNPLGQINKEIKNVVGKLIHTVNHENDTLTLNYNSAGNLIEVVDPLGNTISLEYDIVGNRIQIDDPDLKVTDFVYNAFGELIAKTDAANNTVNTEYDVLGRILERNELEGITRWFYDTQANGLGKLARVESFDNYQELFSYDDLGRPDSISRTIDNRQFTYHYAYNDIGDLSELTYPSEFAVSYTYNNLGYLTSVNRASDNFSYWTAQTVNARGQLESALFGNGITTNKTFNLQTGLLEVVNSSGATTVQDLSFVFDAIGNLTQRKDLQRNLEENFGYDNLNRLLSADVVNGTSLTMQYDRLGNLTYKSDVGTYAYGAGNAGPHAVTSINGTGIANCGFMTSLAGNIDYTSFRKARNISADAIRIEIDYNSSYNRKKMTIYDHEVETKSKIYVGVVYEEETEGDVIKKIHHIKNGSQIVAVYTLDNSGNETTNYLHRDHIGSVQTITDETATIVQTLSYDPWGNRRNAETWAPDQTIAALLDRGFTGHEHLDLVSLINMNGRVYDPVIGRFTSADPFIQEPTNIQSLNRYAYVFNNPLSYTDPSGYWSLKRAIHNISRIGKDIGTWAEDHKKEIAITAAAIAVGVATAGVGTAVMGAVGAGAFSTAVVSGAAFGFGMAYTSTKLSGGSDNQAFKAATKSAIISGVTAGATFGVGEAFGHATTGSNVIQKSIAHGLIQGASTDYQGGKFEHGFLAGSLTTVGEGVKSNYFADNPMADIATSAIVGGTASELGGGKFSNGAKSGAMVTMYNSLGGMINWVNDVVSGATIGAEKEGFWGAVAGGIAGGGGPGSEMYENYMKNNPDKYVIPVVPENVSWPSYAHDLILDDVYNKKGGALEREINSNSKN